MWRRRVSWTWAGAMRVRVDILLTYHACRPAAERASAPAFLARRPRARRDVLRVLVPERDVVAAEARPGIVRLDEEEAAFDDGDERDDSDGGAAPSPIRVARDGRELFLLRLLLRVVEISGVRSVRHRSFDFAMARGLGYSGRRSI